ncbi:hypothetical protein ScPMuIL_012202 [Solemya velum]
MAARTTTRGLTKAAGRLSLLCKHSRSSSLPPKKFLQCASESSDSTSGRKVLSLSSIVLQDGLDIQELPIIVRKLDRSMFPFTKHMYASDDVKKISESDVYFKTKLQNCRTVKDIFKQLEVPSDKVTAYSIAFTLQRICQLKQSHMSADDFDSFISTAIMNELYDTLSKEISTLSNETLFSVVQCYLNMESFDVDCILHINEEVEKRLGDERLSISELCDLSDMFLRNGKEDSDLVQNVWIHVGNRFKDIDEKNITNVYSSLPLRHRYILKMISKQFMRCLWKLQPPDVVSVLSEMVRLNSKNYMVLSNIGKWLFINMAAVSQESIMQIVAGFIHFDYSDVHLIRALEWYIPSRVEKLDPHLVALSMEYCRSRRYLSPIIMNSAAEHFINRGDNYTHLQLYSVLRPYGQINYQPKQRGKFFLKAEDVLSREFDKFDVVHLIEIMSSFAFLGRIPLNFMKQILTPSFLSKVQGIADSEKREQVGMWLEVLQSSAILERSGIKIPQLFRVDKGVYFHRDQRHVCIAKFFSQALDDLIGATHYRTSEIGPNTFCYIDFAIHTDGQGKVVAPSNASRNDRRIAIVIQMPEFHCVNTGHLLGEYATRNRHLKLYKYNLVELPYGELIEQKTKENRVAYLEEKLQKYIKFQ